MTPEEFTDRVTEANETALSRLGSSKSLYADTDGELDADHVLRAAATAERAAAETFATWADAEADEVARRAWEETAAEERDHYERVAAKLDADHEPGEAPQMHDYLRGLDSSAARAGGFLGRVLATDQSKGQFVGFFVGQADPKTAQLFRDLRADLEGQRERAAEVLTAVCGDADDWERAEEAASGAIRAAYEAYVQSLESMGVNPKPVC